LNSGKLMAGLVPAIHAAPRKIFCPLTSVSLDAHDEAVVFSWMAGSSPAMTEKQAPPIPRVYRRGLRMKLVLLAGQRSA
jgi:hypothetical protein